MQFDSLASFENETGLGLGKGPIAVMIAEDRVEVESTLAHLYKLGFKAIVVLAPDEIEIPPVPEGMKTKQFIVRSPSRNPNVAVAIVNAVINKAPGAWIHYCFNSEYLFFPFCEQRTVGELVTWVMEERREAVLTYVVDLYAGDLNAYPNAVSRETALLDASGYYAETRRDADGSELDRQMNFYGGLRWRYEEHVTQPKRKIDRVGLFQAKPNLRLRTDHTLSDPEMNTYACPWHHSLTAAICSFRVAKALRTNPGSRYDISDFKWHKSVEFDWSSMQLMELGLMEPGQWF